MYFQKLFHLDIGNFQTWTNLKCQNSYSFWEIEISKCRAFGFRIHIIWILNISTNLIEKPLKYPSALLCAYLLEARNVISWKFGNVKMNAWFKNNNINGLKEFKEGIHGLVLVCAWLIILGLAGLIPCYTLKLLKAVK